MGSRSVVTVGFAGNSWGQISKLDFPLSEFFPVDVGISISDNPDILFVKETVDSLHAFANLAREDQVRVFFAGEALVPDFNLFDYAIGFDYLDFGDRYFRIHPMLRYRLYGERLERLSDKSDNLASPAVRDNFCSFVYSNSRANPAREEFFHLLSQYKRVDSFGSYLNNMGDSHVRRRWDSDWREVAMKLQEHYRFCISIENARHEGYTSEKLMSGFVSGCIPIYWGNERVSEDFNADRFVNLHDFPDFQDAIEFIIDLDRDPSKLDAIVRNPVMTSQQVSLVEDDKQSLTRLIRRLLTTPVWESRRRGDGTAQAVYELEFFRQLRLRRGFKIPFKVIAFRNRIAESRQSGRRIWFA